MCGVDVERYRKFRFSKGEEERKKEKRGRREGEREEGDILYQGSVKKNHNKDAAECSCRGRSEKWAGANGESPNTIEKEGAMKDLNGSLTGQQTEGTASGQERPKL